MVVRRAHWRLTIGAGVAALAPTLAAAQDVVLEGLPSPAPVVAPNVPMLVSNASGTGMATAPGSAVVPRRDTARSIAWRTFHQSGWDALKARRYDLAETLFRAGLKEAESYGPADPYMASSYTDLGWIFLLKDRPEDAEPLARWALQSRESLFGPFDPRVGDNLVLLAKIATARKQFDDAERLARRAITIYFKSNFGLDDRHPPYALDVLGEVFEASGRLPEAQAIYSRALNLRESALGISMSYPYISEKDVAASYRRLASVLRRLGQGEKADEYEQRAEELDAEAMGGAAAAPPAAAEPAGPAAGAAPLPGAG
jgi:tetratricopeptide (TPR) repeat protein